MSGIYKPNAPIEEKKGGLSNFAKVGLVTLAAATLLGLGALANRGQPQATPSPTPVQTIAHPTATNTAMPTPTYTLTLPPTLTPTPLPTPTNTPRPTSTYTPRPTSTPRPTPTRRPTLRPTFTPRPTNTPIPTPKPTPRPTQVITSGTITESNEDRNNTPSGAIQLFYGQRANGLISYEGDQDYYVFDARRGNWVVIDIDARVRNSQLDSELLLYDSQGNQLARNDDFDEQDSRIEFAIPRDDRYFILVKEYGNDKGGGNVFYQLKLDSLPTDNNETIGTATDTAYGQTIRGVISFYADVDFYRFRGGAGDVIDIDIDAKTVGSSLDSEITLFDAEGNRLAQNDDFDTQDSYIRYRLTRNGTYYIRVVEYGGDKGGEDVFYDLNLRSSNSDGNDSRSSATPIEYGAVIQEGMEYEDDVDFYRFDGSIGDVVNIDVRARIDGSEMDSYLVLYDSRGNELAQNDDFSGQDSFIEFRLPSDGRYFIEVRDYRRDGGRDYFYTLYLTRR